MIDIHYNALVWLVGKLYKISSESILLDLLGCDQAADISYYDYCFILGIFAWSGNKTNKWEYQYQRIQSLLKWPQSLFQAAAKQNRLWLES